MFLALPLCKKVKIQKLFFFSFQRKLSPLDLMKIKSLGVLIWL